ncbi:helix-turn-helix domain-containing protein [Paraburkholderia sp. 2C]
MQAVEIADVFERANRHNAGASAPHYKITFLSASGGHVTCSLRIAVLTQKLPEPAASRRGLRALFVAGGDGANEAACDPRLVAWLREASAAAETVSAIGEGSSILRAACAHPSDAVRGASMVSAVETALDLVRRDLGADAAREVATQLSWTSLPKPVSIALDSHEPIKRKIRDSAQWIARNCDKRISITTAAQHAGMSERSYLRHFRAEMGIKPSEHLRRTRVELASTLLAQSDLPVDKIARRCGLTSGECLARLFRQVVHLSPTEYRSRARHDPA